MYYAEVLTIATKAMSTVFDADHPQEDFRDLLVSIEYPIDATQYPSIWVDFEPTSDLEAAGIGHIEFEQDEDGFRQFTRWRFTGIVHYTICCLANLSRARMVDELIRVFASGNERAATAEFRSLIENNELVAMNASFDRIHQGGWAATQGTPWGSDDTIYEATLSLDVVGEFCSEGKEGRIVPLDSVVVYPYNPPVEPDPTVNDPDGAPWV
jgi:hypothetical protein